MSKRKSSDHTSPWITRRRSVITVSIAGGIALALGGVGIVSTLDRTPPEIPEELQQAKDSEGRNLPYPDISHRMAVDIRNARTLNDQLLAVSYEYSHVDHDLDCVRYDANIEYTNDALIISLERGYIEGYQEYCPPPENDIMLLPYAPGFSSLMVPLEEPHGERALIDASTGEEF